MDTETSFAKRSQMESTSPAYRALKASKGKILSTEEKDDLVNLLKKEGFKRVRTSKDSSMWTSYASETMLIIVQIFQHPITSPSSNYRIKTEYAKNYKDFIYAVVACSDALGKLFVVD